MSSLESKRILKVPERSLSIFWHYGCPMYTSRKLHIKFQIYTFLGSAPHPICLQSVIMESKMTLVVPERSLGGFWHCGCSKDTSRKLHINFLGSVPFAMFIQSVIMESKDADGYWEESWWFLTWWLPQEYIRTLYRNVVPLVNNRFVHLTTVQTKTSFGVSLFVKHRLLSGSERWLSASLLLKTCR